MLTFRNENFNSEFPQRVLEVGSPKGPVEDTMQIWHVTNKEKRLNVLEKFHTHRETKRDNQTKALLKAAERAWDPLKFFFEPPSKDRQASEKVRKQQ
jgi:hypothetical protein